MKKINISDIVFLSFYTALIIILTFVPQTGYIQFWGGFHITVIPFFIIFATYHLQLKGLITTTLCFAFGSYLKSLFMGRPLFSNPLVSVLPRIIMIFFIYVIWKSTGKLKLWKLILNTCLIFILNTFFISMCLWFYVSVGIPMDFDFKNGIAFWFIWFPLIYINVMCEILGGILLSCLLYYFLLIIIKKHQSIKENKYEKNITKNNEYEKENITKNYFE